MLTLYITGLIVCVFLIPGIVFRGFFSLFLPLRRFQRTRIEEIAFAVKVCAVPFVIVALLAWFTNLAYRLPIHTGIDSASLASAAYVVLRAAVDDTFVRGDSAFAAYLHMSREVLSFAVNLLLAYYAFLALEACLLGWFGSKFGDPRYRERFRWIVERVLLPGISEWYVLLTTFTSRKDSPRVVVADVLTTDDHLYHGQVENYYLDKDGALSGILLSNTFRFDRQGYVRSLQQGPVANRQPFWKRIPGKNVYVFADRITNININQELLAAVRIKNELRLDPTLQLEIESS
jgi:hypothetical protein